VEWSGLTGLGGDTINGFQRLTDDDDMDKKQPHAISTETRLVRNAWKAWQVKSSQVKSSQVKASRRAPTMSVLYCTIPHFCFVPSPYWGGGTSSGLGSARDTTGLISSPSCWSRCRTYYKYTKCVCEPTIIILSWCGTVPTYNACDQIDRWLVQVQYLQNS
jgi:hypothetical protein